MGSPVLRDIEAGFVDRRSDRIVWRAAIYLHRLGFEIHDDPHDAVELVHFVFDRRLAMPARHGRHGICVSRGHLRIPCLLRSLRSEESFDGRDRLGNFGFAIGLIRFSGTHHAMAQVFIKQPEPDALQRLTH